MRVFPKCLDIDLDAPSVLVPFGADDRALEAALAAVGIFAPRGLDWTAWYVQSPTEVVATIYDGSGEPIVMLFATEEARKGIGDLAGEVEQLLRGQRTWTP